MCGGRVEIIPCSHVGHMYRPAFPYSWGENSTFTLQRNCLRVAEVWLDEYKKVYYERISGLQVRNKYKKQQSSGLCYYLRHTEVFNNSAVCSSKRIVQQTAACSSKRIVQQINYGVCVMFINSRSLVIWYIFVRKLLLVFCTLFIGFDKSQYIPTPLKGVLMTTSNLWLPDVILGVLNCYL